MTGSTLSVNDSPLSSPARFKAVALTAGILAGVFTVAHVVLALTAVPYFAALYNDMGGKVPGFTQLLFGLSRVGALPILVLVVDVAVFFAMYALAKRYWIGLLFAPVAVYLSMSVALLPLLFMPLSSVVTIVE